MHNVLALLTITIQVPLLDYCHISNSPVLLSVKMQNWRIRKGTVSHVWLFRRLSNVLTLAVRLLRLS